MRAAQRAKDRTGTLLDELMPEFDFRSRHSITVAAPPERVAAAAESYRPASSPLTRLLFRLRGLGGPSGGTLRSAPGFTFLDERPGEEWVLGAAGRFWALDERAALAHLDDARAFLAYEEPGTAKGALSLRIEPLDDGGTRLSTETRVRCADPAAYRRFAFYWALIKPASGWIRNEMLCGIARQAMASTDAP